MTEPTAGPILIIDDDANIRRVLRRAIQAKISGHEIQEAANGADGMELLQKARPALVMLDLGLPLVGGIEVCRRVRKLWPGTPVIVMTGNLMPSLATEKDLGDAFLEKPVDLEQLTKTVKSLLAA